MTLQGSQKLTYRQNTNTVRFNKIVHVLSTRLTLETIKRLYTSEFSGNNISLFPYLFQSWIKQAFYLESV